MPSETMLTEIGEALSALEEAMKAAAAAGAMEVLRPCLLKAAAAMIAVKRETLENGVGDPRGGRDTLDRMVAGLERYAENVEDSSRAVELYGWAADLQALFDALPARLRPGADRGLRWLVDGRTDVLIVKSEG